MISEKSLSHGCLGFLNLILNPALPCPSAQIPRSKDRCLPSMELQLSRKPLLNKILQVLYESTTADPRQATSIHQRIAHSDIQTLGRESDANLTYGEYDLELFCRLLKEADPQPGDCFIDIGSGVGRLVIAAAMLYDNWSVCTGLELLPSLHSLALSKIDDLKIAIKENPHLGVTLPEIRLFCGSWEQPQDTFIQCIASPGISFAYSTTWTADDGGGGELRKLSEFLALHAKTGNRIITADKQLAVECLQSRRGFQIEKIIPGKNSETGTSTGYVHKVVDLGNTSY